MLVRGATVVKERGFSNFFYRASKRGGLQTGAVALTTPKPGVIL